MLKRTQEEESAATAEAESRKRLDEAKAAIAALEEETARLEMEKEAAKMTMMEKETAKIAYIAKGPATTAMNTKENAKMTKERMAKMAKDNRTDALPTSTSSETQLRLCTTRMRSREHVPCHS